MEAAQEDGSWYCRLNPNELAAAAGCKMPEEAYMAPQSAAADTRVVKKRYNEVRDTCYGDSSPTLAKGVGFQGVQHITLRPL